jgi:hypothetical protein
VTTLQLTPLPAGALLQRYAATGAYTDCYGAELPGAFTLADFMASFYTSPVFKVERWLLSRLPRFRATDREAVLLAQGELAAFSAWTVEAREPQQALLAAGRTRSWLMVSPSPTHRGVTALYFGSAVLPRKRGGLGWQFTALLGFHKLYSRWLLGSALKRMIRSHAKG